MFHTNMDAMHSLGYSPKYPISNGQKIYLRLQNDKYRFSLCKSSPDSPAVGFSKDIVPIVPTSGDMNIKCENSMGITGVHHVAVICENLEVSLDFYCNIMGLPVNPDRPEDKLPYRGAWLWMGPEMLHLMELPNPDPYTGRPDHGGRDRHVCIGTSDINKVTSQLDKANIKYTASKSGRPAVFFRDPDMNTIEIVQSAPWR